jgi:hypothetical protein
MHELLFLVLSSFYGLCSAANRYTMIAEGAGIGHVVGLIGGASVVLIQFQDVSVHPFHAGDEVVDPVVNPLMNQRILVVDVPKPSLIWLDQPR